MWAYPHALNKSLAMQARTKIARCMQSQANCKLKWHEVRALWLYIINLERNQKSPEDR